MEQQSSGSGISSRTEGFGVIGQDAEELSRPLVVRLLLYRAILVEEILDPEDWIK